MVTSSGVLTRLLPPRHGTWSGARSRTAVSADQVPRHVSSGHLHRRVVRMLVDGREEALERRLAAEGAAAAVDVRLVLVAELVDVARDRHRGRVAERAEALAEDPVADREQEVELALLGASVLDLAQELDHPP